MAWLHYAKTLSGGFHMTPSIKGHEGYGLCVAFEAFNEPSKTLYTALEIILHVAQITCVIQLSLRACGDQTSI